MEGGPVACIHLRGKTDANDRVALILSSTL
jgi:hypothetical protein